LGTDDYLREVSHEPHIALFNRYFETNPTNQENQTALLSRPPLRKWLEVGDGPIRATYTQPGAFDDALFVVSGRELYKISIDENISLVGTIASTVNFETTPKMVATGNIGTSSEILFITDAGKLFAYGNSVITNFAGNLIAGDTVTMGSSTYVFATTGLDSGTQDGSTAHPYKVLLGDTNSESLSNLARATNYNTGGGTYYTQSITAANPDVRTLYTGPTFLYAQAVTGGDIGNSIPVTVNSLGALWQTATLTGGGGGAGLISIQTPDGLQVDELGYISGYVVVVPSAGQTTNGRFYWIDAGEIFIDGLNFATAERTPDGINAVRVIGDNLWLFGPNSVEVWYATGDLTAPFKRVQGRLFDRGIWGGTPAQIKDYTVFVDKDGVVYANGASPIPISTHAVEERIRKAIRYQLTGV
jgi:hypothetical protein